MQCHLFGRPDGFLFRQIYDFPRMVLNKAGATSTDTIHRLTCKDGKAGAGHRQYLYLADGGIGRDRRPQLWRWRS